MGDIARRLKEASDMFDDGFDAAVLAAENIVKERPDIPAWLLVVALRKTAEQNRGKM